LLGTPRLFIFCFRALVLILLLSMLWMSMAKRYNQAVTSLARPMLPDGVSVRVLGSRILVANQSIAEPLSVDGLTLHSGLVLLTVLVLAAVGIGVWPRIGWLLAMVCGAFGLHVLGVALLARGVAWAASTAAPAQSARLVFSLFAIFWGLVPAVIGGLWCYLYWRPRAWPRGAPQGARGAPQGD
jgi:hypothetical protein